MTQTILTNSSAVPAPGNTIVGQTFLDVNANGVRDGSEPALAGVTIVLVAAGTTFATATTDINGQYTLSAIQPGTYAIGVIAPPGDRISPLGTANNLPNSVVDPTTGLSASFAVAGGVTLIGENAGLIPPAPTLTGLGTATMGPGPFMPFAGATVTDQNPSQVETLTLVQTPSSFTTITDPNAATDGGTISGGTYRVSGSPSLVSAILRGITITPTGTATVPSNGTVTVGLSATIADSLGLATGGVSSLTIVYPPPSIAGTTGNQFVRAGGTNRVFATTTISDANTGPATQTLSVTFNPAAGTLTDPNAATDGAFTGPGSLSITGSAAAVTTALRGLTFQPSAIANVTNTLTILDRDTIGLAATDSTTSVQLAASPSIVGTRPNQGVANGDSVSPFSGVTILQSDTLAVETLTVVADLGQGTLFDPNAATSGGVFTAQGTFRVIGSASLVTAALRGLAYTAASANAYVGNTGFTITVTDLDGSAVDNSANVASALQLYGLAAATPSGRAYAVAANAVNSAGSVGVLNEAIVYNPSTAGVYTLGSGFVGGYLGGTAAATLQDTVNGGALLVGNNATSTLIASVANDLLIGGLTGGNTLVLRASGAAIGHGGGNTFILSAGTSVIAPGTGANIVNLGTGTSTVVDVGSDSVIGGGGSDFIFALGPTTYVENGSTAVFISGTSANTITAGTGVLTAFGGPRGGNLIQSGSGRLVYIGGAAGSTVAGGSGSATIYGGTGGADNLAGGSAGNNVLVSGTGPTTLVGGGAGDRLFLNGAQNSMAIAGAGNETLQGAFATGNNTYVAGAGPDLVQDGSGLDTVRAGAGPLSIQGGMGGARTIVFRSGDPHGSVSVFDFNLRDSISLLGYGPSAAAQVMATQAPVGLNTVLVLPDATQVTLIGVARLTSGGISST